MKYLSYRKARNIHDPIKAVYDNMPDNYGPCAYCDRPKQFPSMAICYECWLIEQAYIKDMETEYRISNEGDDNDENEIPF